MPNGSRIEVRQTDEFASWLGSLKDKRSRTRVRARLDRLEFGNFGDSKSLGEGLFELRLKFSPGFRIYFIRQGDIVVILLCGGDKSSQKKDIARARMLANEFEE